jgi:hypothetical protein
VQALDDVRAADSGLEHLARLRADLHLLPALRAHLHDALRRAHGEAVDVEVPVAKVSGSRARFPHVEPLVVDGLP